MKPIYEQFRPTTWDEVVGQDEAVQQLRRIESRLGFGGQAIWISGASGTGKTSIARLIAASIAEEDAIEFVSADDLTVAKLRDYETYSRMFGGWGDEKHGRAFIIDESHGLKKNVIRKLLVTLESVPQHVTWIFTTTSQGQLSMMDGVDAGPLLSRCLQVALESSSDDLILAFGDWLWTVAVSEGWCESKDHPDASHFYSLVRECDCNLRAAMQRVAAGI